MFVMLKEKLRNLWKFQKLNANMEGFHVSGWCLSDEIKYLPRSV